ncbi:MAG: beta-glucosidase [Bifidobacteriaceae bacterium]|jgi:beta-glucosidase|nr:beta-glucosidase [Bifidobacteriaceae bacterium]
MSINKFPEGFGWGTATASYQIEGAVAQDGRLPSIWDTFSHTPGKILDGTNGDRACDHYNRYEADVDLMADLGATYYRFSLAWPRIQPDGRGAVNPKGVDFYKRLVDKLRSKGITPWATLYHWDLPQALQDAGGWPVRDCAYWFEDYAALAFEQLRDHIDIWTSLNEPICSSFLSYSLGEHAPGWQDPAAALRASHHLLLGHGLALQHWRSVAGPNHQFGITINLSPVVCMGDTAADRDAARRVDGITNRWFLDPVLKGEYPADVLADLAQFTSLDFIQPGDLEIIHQPMDAFGLNYYNRAPVKAGGPDAGEKWRGGIMALGCGDVATASQGLPVTARGWEIDPAGLVWTLKWLTETYDMPPIWITENGSAWDDQVGPDGAVHDPDRVKFLEAHFRAARQAIDEGVDLRGYFPWSLMDNFEWAFGESSRFGMVYIDYETQQRIPKDSFYFYRDVIAAGGVEG